MKEEKERKRKVYAKAGERSQRLMSFRIDNDNWEWLQQLENRGRYINELIAAQRK